MLLLKKKINHKKRIENLNYSKFLPVVAGYKIESLRSRSGPMIKHY